VKPVTRAVVATAGIALAVYLPTMSRSIGFVDRGELSAVATTLGIAHPTGYPTLTLLGHFFVWLGGLASLRPVLALNVLAALCVALGAGIMVPLLAKAVRAAAPAAGEGAVAIVAALSVLGTVLGATWWQQANGFEAYALQALFLPLVSLAFFEWLEHPGDRSWRGRGALFGFLLGLSLTNHLTTVLTAPAFAVAYLLARGFRRETWLGILRAVPAFVLGLTPYLYLLLRAADMPRFNWGDPDTLSRLVEHVTAKQYRVWMFANPDDMKLQFDFLIAHLPWDVSFVGLVLAVAGFAVLVRRDARLAWFSVLIFAGAMTFASGYSIRDIDPYVMPGLLGIGILSAGALGALLARRGLVAASAVGASVVVLSVALHWRACDESGNRLAEDYSRNLLASLPPRAVLFSTQWDHLVSPTYYLQAVEGVRPDVTVIDSELLRRSWYVRELQRRDPGLMAAVTAEAQRFLEEVAVYEAGRPYDGNRVQGAFDGMKDAIVTSTDRPVCATADSDPDPFRKRVRVPQRMVAELAADTGYVELGDPPAGFRYRRWAGRRDHLTAGVGFGYASALAARIGYEIQHGRPERAPELAREALGYHPGFEAGDLPPLPLDTRAVTLETLGLFDRLRAASGVAAPPFR
jgi:hypothetical protein